MNFRKASIKDLERLYRFYNIVIDHQQYDLYGAGWTKDVYPSFNDLKVHLENDHVYILEEEGQIIGSGIISLKEDDMYKKAKWSKAFEDEEIAVFHLFAVHPEHRGRGFGSLLLKHIIEKTKDTSKAIHMDVVKGNDNARAMYLNNGFVSIGDFQVYYEDTGDIIVELMEYVY